MLSPAQPLNSPLMLASIASLHGDEAASFVERSLRRIEDSHWFSAAISSGVSYGIRPQRARILMRDGRCVICGSREQLQVGHLLPVAGGLAAGLTEAELNDDENLAAMCAECNAGLGEAPPLWITVPLLKLRLRRVPPGDG